MDIPELASLLHESEGHHGAYEKTHAKHDWWDWYAAYIEARQRGEDADHASASANRYMDEALHISAR